MVSSIVKPRICRISGNYTQHPYQLAVRMKLPTLFLVRKQRRADWPLPEHVTLREIPFPVAALPEDTSGADGQILDLPIYGYGQVLFALRSLPYLRRFRPHIVHLHSAWPMLNGLMAKLATRSCLAITIVGTDYKRLMKTPAAGRILRQADKVCYVARFMERGLARLVSADRLFYTPTGVDLKLFSPGGPRHTRQRHELLAVGSYTWTKDPATLIRAMRLVVDCLPDAHLRIAGTGSQLKQIIELIDELGLQRHVTLLGKVTMTDVSELLAQSDLFVMSSVSEGMPKAILEAIAAATPMVVTDVGDCSQLAEGVGWSVPRGDREHLASSIMSLLENDEVWERFHQQALRKRRQYSWEQTVKAVSTAYERLLME